MNSPMTYYKAGKHQTQMEQHFRVRALLQSADHLHILSKRIHRAAVLIQRYMLPCITYRYSPYRSKTHPGRYK